MFYIPWPTAAADFERPEMGSNGPAAASEESLRSHPALPEVVEKVGFGAGQGVAIAAACGTFFAEGLELLIVCLLAPAIAQDLGAAAGTEGLVVSSVFAGALVGNLLSGPLADLAGRRLPISLAYSTTVFFGVVGSFMHSLWSVSAFRFLVGLGLGLGQPAAVALVSELSPEHRRLVSVACSSVLFGAGALVAVLMVMWQDAWLQSLDTVEWRLLLRMGAFLVGMFGLGSIFFLPESPSFLASVGDRAQARDVLEALRRRNGRRGVPVMFKSGESSTEAPSFASVVADTLGPDVRSVTLRLCFVALVLNFALYGCGYAVPQALAQSLPHSGEAGLAPTTVLVLALALAGVALPAAAVSGGGMPLDASIRASLAWASASALLFATAAQAEDPGVAIRLLLVISCVGLCAGPAFGTLCLLQAAAALLPTVASATGAALCLSVGRLGAAAAPLAADLLQQLTGGWCSFLLLCAGLELAALLLASPPSSWESTRPVAWESP